MAKFSPLPSVSELSEATSFFVHPELHLFYASSRLNSVGRIHFHPKIVFIH